MDYRGYTGNIRATEADNAAGDRLGCSYLQERKNAMNCWNLDVCCDYYKFGCVFVVVKHKTVILCIIQIFIAKPQYGFAPSDVSMQRTFRQGDPNELLYVNYLI